MFELLKLFDINNDKSIEVNRLSTLTSATIKELAKDLAHKARIINDELDDLTGDSRQNVTHEVYRKGTDILKNAIIQTTQGVLLELGKSKFMFADFVAQKDEHDYLSGLILNKFMEESQFELVTKFLDMLEDDSKFDLNQELRTTLKNYLEYARSIYFAPINK